MYIDFFQSLLFYSTILSVFYLFLCFLCVYYIYKDIKNRVSNTFFRVFLIIFPILAPFIVLFLGLLLLVLWINPIFFAFLAPWMPFLATWLYWSLIGEWKELVTLVMNDVKLLYKNLLHWNISKIVYYIYGVLLAIALSIPVLIIFFVFIWISPFDVSFILSFFTWDISTLEFWAELLAHPIAAVLSFIILLSTILSAYIGIAYAEYLLYGLNFEYLKDKKTKYISKKRFLNYKMLIKYITIWAWVSLFSLIPYIVSLIVFAIFVFGFGGVAALSEYLFVNPKSLVSIGILLLLLLTVLVSIYIVFRTAFAWLILMDVKKTSTRALSYVKKSVKITKGSSKALRFVWVLLPFIIILLPIFVVLDNMQQSLLDMSEYREFVVAESQFGKTEFIQELSTNKPKLYEKYQYLSQRYEWIDLNILSSEISKLNILNMISLVIYFLAIYGLIHMVFSSFYVRELKENK